jgi:hypothetical protein
MCLRKSKSVPNHTSQRVCKTKLLQAASQRLVSTCFSEICYAVGFTPQCCTQRRQAGIPMARQILSDASSNNVCRFVAFVVIYCRPPWYPHLHENWSRSSHRPLIVWDNVMLFCLASQELVWDQTGGGEGHARISTNWVQQGYNDSWIVSLPFVVWKQFNLSPNVHSLRCRGVSKLTQRTSSSQLSDLMQCSATYIQQSKRLLLVQLNNIGISCQQLRCRMSHN